jgi:predicted translin family RNA/ssDNA-binding protein
VIFADEHRDLLEACERTLREYQTADRDDAEERYGDYVDAVDEAREALEDMHDTYAATLGGTAAGEYTGAFTREAKRRFPDLALELE